MKKCILEYLEPRAVPSCVVKSVYHIDTTNAAEVIKVERIGDDLNISVYDQDAGQYTRQETIDLTGIQCPAVQVASFGGDDVVQIGGIEAVGVFGGDGNDRITALNSNPYPQTYYGEDGNDTLIGGGGDDWLMGGSGEDFIHGNDGDDTINGGSGADTIIGGNGADLLYVDLLDLIYSDDEDEIIWRQ